MASPKQLFANNAKGKLNAGILAADTALTLQGGQGALFPNPSGGDWFLSTLIDTSGNIEIIKVTTRVTDGFTVIERGQEGTIARAFSAADIVEARWTKGSAEQMVALTGAQTVKDKTFTNPGITKQVLIEAAPVVWNLDLGSIAELTLTANRNLGTPTNMKPGTVMLKVIQGGAGGFTLTLPGEFKHSAGVPPPLSSVAGAVDLLSYFCDGALFFGGLAVRGAA